MRQDTEKRPLIAALLTFLQPGLAHCYHREWLRACLWAGVPLGSLAGVASADPRLTVIESVAAAVGVFPGTEGFPPTAVLAMVAVTAVATLDAYWLTARNDHRLRGDVGRRPHCGRDLDPPSRSATGPPNRGMATVPTDRRTRNTAY